MKSSQRLLLASSALFALILTQPPAYGAEAVHALRLAQVAPQNDKGERAIKRRNEAGKKEPAHKPEIKEHGRATHPENSSKQEHAKPVTRHEQPQARPTVAGQKKLPPAQPHRMTEQGGKAPRGSEKMQNSERLLRNKNGKPPTAAQRLAPTTVQHENIINKAEHLNPERGRAHQTKENTKPSSLKAQQVGQHNGAQPSIAPTGKATQEHGYTAPKAAQRPVTSTPHRAAAAPPPPSKPLSASSFILRQDEKPSQGLNEVRRTRRETRVGNRIIIREGDRTIERENNHAIIYHSESDRFAVGARRVDVEHRNDRIVTVILRPNGVRIISTADEYGHLIRRVRQDPDGREIVIIDDSRFAPRRRDEMFINVPPPRIADRDRYMVDADHADRRQLYEVFTAPPIERLQGYYTVDQVRYNYELREYMPRVDLDIHFDTGSWQLTPRQVDRLSVVAAALNEAINRNPREVFLIEGHTDAVGSWEDNLSLSDRRAEAVAVALTEQFDVPPENLVTQGYGEEYLKVPTQGPSRANRRVVVRRITPLIAQAGDRER